MKFEEFNIQEVILKGIYKAGYKECMPVQEKTFPPAFQGKDIYVQSQTGSGKTAAFMIPIFQRFLNEPHLKGKKALIVAPTRELADQISKEANILGEFLTLKTGVFFGGVGYGKQEKLLAEGVDIIVGTPGRLIDFSESKKINFKEIAIFIIDEADRLFDMGFFPDLKRMIKKMPPHTERQTMLFSATLDDRVKYLAGNYMNDPVEINLSPEKMTVENIDQRLYHVGTEDKMNLLIGILKQENPGNAIIFTNTKHKAVEISKRLELNGYSCEFLIGDLPQTQRLSIISRIKSGELRFLIATDVAARGLHIDDLDMVINYDLPEHSESYVHRIGRTARAGKSGKAISLACEHFVYSLQGIEDLIDMKIPVHWADDGLYASDKSAGMRIHVSRDHDRGRDRKRRDSEPGKSAKSQRRKKKTHSTEERPAKATAVQKEKKPASARPEKQKRERKKTDRREPGKLKPGSSIEDRLQYYSQKYGETFKDESGKTSPKKKPKKNFIKRVFTFFRLQNK